MNLERHASRIIFAVFLLASGALAQPEVSDVTGDLIENGTLIISGRGFGDKNPATPVLYDRLTNIDAYQGLAEGDPIPTRATDCASCPWQDATMAGGDGVRYSTRTSRYMGGAAYVASSRGRLGFPDLGGAIPDKLYVNWWVYTTELLAPDERSKLIRVRERRAESAAFVEWSPVSLARIPDTDHDGRPESETADSGPWGGAPRAWTNLELRVDTGDRGAFGSGLAEALTNMEPVHRAEFWASEPLNCLASIGLDTVDPEAAAGVEFAWTDIYIDTTFARVMISDSPTAQPGSHCEIQIPVSWSPNHVEVTAVLGGFQDRGPLYLFVFDDDGRRSEVGYPLPGDEAGEGPGRPGHPGMPGAPPPHEIGGGSSRK